jgi:ABC-type transporter Mla MlaB component
MNSLSLVIEDSRASITGELSFFTVLTIREQAMRYVTNTSQPMFNFSGVNKADSAAVALMIEWWRAASLAKKAIAFEALTPSLISLIRVSNLQEVFGLK